MTLIAVTQRVDIIESYNERRDAIDQQWYLFLEQAGSQALLIPNNAKIASTLIDNIKIDGVILTGGNSLAEYGGDAPERDETELFLLQYAINKKIPVIGVCRGMQMIQNFYNTPLQSIDEHIMKKQRIIYNGEEIVVNSFHTIGAYNSVEELLVLGKSSDGVIKAVKHVCHQILGIMWHPERIHPFRSEDIALFKGFFEQ